MHNAYFEVARTYVKRPLTSWMGALWTLVSLVQVIVTLANPRLGRIATLRMVFMALVFGGSLLWVHFREQVVSERRRLWPGFVGPQVQIFTAMVALLVIGWPVALILRGGPPSIGLMACAAVCMAWLGWSILAMPWMLFVGGMLIFLWMMSGEQSRWVEPLLNGQNEPLAITMLVVALIVIGVTMARMLRLTEEDRAYGRQPQFSSWSLRPRVTGEMNAAWREAEGHKLFRWLRAGAMVHIPTGPGLWERVRRWRGLNRGMPLYMVILAVSMIAGPRLVASSSNHTSPMVAIMLNLIPAAMVGNMWLQRWRFLETESLRPIDRGSFLKEIGLAIGIDILQAWAAFAAVVVADALLFGPRSIETGWGVAMFFASLMLQVLAFGMVVSMMRYRSIAWLMAGSFPALIVPGMAIMIASEEPFPHRLLVVSIGASAVAAVGMYIARDAYRRWLVTELA